MDNHETYRVYAAALISRFGFEVTTRTDGDEALEVLSSGRPSFDLLIIDCEMPRLNGLDLIKAVRRKKAAG